MSCTIPKLAVLFFYRNLKLLVLKVYATSVSKMTKKNKYSDAAKFNTVTGNGVAWFF